jgi:hypothetical protein
MKKLLTILTWLLMTIAISAQVPCPNDNNFWLDLTPTGNGNTQTSTCSYAGDYDTFTATSGYTYSFSVCPGSYNVGVTMYTSTGTLLFSQDNVGNGACETWTWTATVSGTIRILVDKANCGTNSICTSVSVTQTSGGSGGTGNVDCSSPTQVCNDASFTGNSNGAGTQELNAGNQGCMSTEHQSSWYIFNVVSSGTLALNITTAVDYDFAIWGPNVSCGALGAPVRCSWAAGGGNTGLGNGASDVTEGAGGDRWVQTLNVTAGQTYIMLIDNFTANSTSFTLDWTMTGGASLNCIPLPIELISFNGYPVKNYNVLKWITATEINNDYFTLEKSSNGLNWDIVTKLKGAGNSTSSLSYEYKDYDVSTQINYYRLKQTDYNGVYKYHNIITIDNTETSKSKIIKITNLLGQDVEESYNGVKIYQYSDGKCTKVIETN